MPASDLTGYLQGYKFRDNPTYWDSANSRFLDLSGFGIHCDVEGGAPVFSTPAAGTVEGWKMSVGVLGRALNPVPWQGTAVFVGTPHVGTSGYVPLCGIGPANSSASDRGIGVRRFSASSSVWGVYEGQSLLRVTYDSGGAQTVVFAVSWSQADLTFRLARPGQSDITSAGASSQVMALGYGADVTTERSRYMVRTSGNEPWIHEVHYFRGDAITDQSAALQAYLTELATEYA